MKKLIELTDLTQEELISVLNRADYLKRCWDNNEMPQILSDQRIALWFQGADSGTDWHSKSERDLWEGMCRMCRGN